MALSVQMPRCSLLHISVLISLVSKSEGVAGFSCRNDLSDPLFNTATEVVSVELCMSKAHSIEIVFFAHEMLCRPFCIEIIVSLIQLISMQLKNIPNAVKDN